MDQMMVTRLMELLGTSGVGQWRGASELWPVIGDQGQWSVISDPRLQGGGVLDAVETLPGALKMPIDHCSGRLAKGSLPCQVGRLQ